MWPLGDNEFDTPALGQNDEVVFPLLIMCTSHGFEGDSDLAPDAPCLPELHLRSPLQVLSALSPVPTSKFPNLILLFSELLVILWVIHVY